MHQNGDLIAELKKAGIESAIEAGKKGEDGKGDKKK